MEKTSASGRSIFGVRLNRERRGSGADLIDMPIKKDRLKVKKNQKGGVALIGYRYQNAVSEWKSKEK